MRHCYARLGDGVLSFRSKDERDRVCAKVFAVPCSYRDAAAWSRFSGDGLYSAASRVNNASVLMRELGLSRNVAIWTLMGDFERAEARRLSEEYAYPTWAALQQAYIFGHDDFAYDYRRDAARRKDSMAGTF